jgi:hypothetical protein
MGSSGSGSFSDYPGYKQNNSSKSNHSQGDSSGEDACSKAFSTSLDDVASCNYYLMNKSVPPEKTNIIIAFEKRIVAKDSANNTIGYLPTKFNYLKACMEDGFRYNGIVQSSANSPIPSVIIAVGPV